MARGQRVGDDEEDGEGEGSPRTAKPRGDNHEEEGGRGPQGRSWSRSGRAAERTCRRCARATCHKGQRASAVELSRVEPKCAAAPQGVHPDRGSHCVGGGALGEARSAVAKRRSSRSREGQRPGATRPILRVKGGRVRQMGKPGERSTDAHGCDEVGRAGRQRAAPLPGGSMPRVQPVGCRGRATPTGWQPARQPVARPAVGVDVVVVRLSPSMCPPL